MGIDQTEFKVEETARAGVYTVRRMDLFERWEAEGKISPEQRSAALAFKRDFHAARFDASMSAVAALNSTRATADGADRVASSIYDARKSIADAMRVVGPTGGDAMWEVVGMERSLRDYSVLSNKRLNVHEVKGRLMAALDTLARHWGYV